MAALVKAKSCDTANQEVMRGNAHMKPFTQNPTEKRRLEICRLACKIAWQIKDRIKLGEHRIHQQNLDVPTGLGLADMFCEDVLCKLQETDTYSKQREQDELKVISVEIQASVIIMLRVPVSSTLYQLVVSMNFDNTAAGAKPCSINWTEITTQERGTVELDDWGAVKAINNELRTPVRVPA